MKWLLLILTGLLAGVVGCSRVELPRVGEQGPGGAGAQSTVSPQGAGPSEMEELCAKFDANLAGLPEVRISEYPLIQERIRQISPLVGQDAELMQRAHVRALDESNQAVIQLLRRIMNDPQADIATRTKARRYGSRFVRAIRTSLDPARPRGEQDLRMVVSAILQVREGTPCANGYLSHFYAVYLRELDPFSQIAFGSSEASPQEDTRGLSVARPQGMATAPVFEERDHGQPAMLTMHSWDPQETRATLDGALGQLESRASHLPGLVLDLRYAGGADDALLAKLRASAARGWGRLPIVIWVNYATHGLADVFAYELSQKPNVEVFGPDTETYGYARRLKSDSTILIDGLAPVHLSIGAELLEPAGSQGHDGLRVRVPRKNVKPDAGLTEVIEEGLTWIHDQAQNPAPALAVEAPAQPEPKAPSDSQDPDASPAQAQQIVMAAPPVQMPPQVQPVAFVDGHPVTSLPPAGEPSEPGAAGTPEAAAAAAVAQDPERVDPNGELVAQPQPGEVPPAPAVIPPNPYTQPLQREFTHPAAIDGAAGMDNASANADALAQPQS